MALKVVDVLDKNGDHIPILTALKLHSLEIRPRMVGAEVRAHAGLGGRADPFLKLAQLKQRSVALFFRRNKGLSQKDVVLAHLRFLAGLWVEPTDTRLHFSPGFRVGHGLRFQYGLKASNQNRLATAAPPTNPKQSHPASTNVTLVPPQFNSGQLIVR
jgi:hypothetical protein